MTEEQYKGICKQLDLVFWVLCFISGILLSMILVFK